MVRLCVPAGDNQHVLTRRPPVGFSAAEPSLIDSAYRACLVATGLTAFGSILGIARPGLFLRNVTFVGLIDGVVTACDIYGRQEINKAVFKMDGLENPKPFKLWERSKHWTLEDASLFGGASGLLMASNPRLFPGATGFSRFFGVAIAGCAVSTKIAEWADAHAPRVQMIRTMQQRAAYQRLSQDENAKSTLSRFGKALLMSYTKDNPLMRTLSKPFGGLSGAATPSSIAAELAQSAQTKSARRQAAQAHAGQHFIMLVEFDKGELAAPDYEEGYRLFKLDPTDTDLETLQEHLDHLKKLRDSEAKELAFIWRVMAPKEHKMHQLSQEDPEKDLLRRELQLLNSIACSYNTRFAIISFAQADARKRIAQIRNENSSVVFEMPLPGKEIASLEDNWSETHIPQKTVDLIRQRWENARTTVAGIENALAEFDELKAQGFAGHLSKQTEDVRNHQWPAKQNVLATERLLKEFEDHILKPEGTTGR
ncbi:hypothetical protein C7974DRAFT_423035 [Boeremia exigua]|uniref:uncharacterized protein n=1 Tax=Boeremia exigua TaxID=749465 RepID=UPI001E8CBBCC|nr:uncharacterized protein C7974DRAFT_423035 [Boeremia exigua]KAH6638112.1 hypothetical protein C7974DRAFT_423035 [Boeremia exigua]